MAGRYFTDPRPFYFLSGDQKFSFMDDCFAPGKKDGNKFIESDLKKQPEKSKGKDEESKEKEKEKAETGKKKVEDKSKTVEVRVNLCCNRCERKVREALQDVPGVELVDCDQLNRKVLVKGSVKPEVVLKKVKKLKRDAELVGKN